MPSTKDFSRRIDILDECLRRRQKKWTVEALLETLNGKLIAEFNKKVSIRTLYNDLKYLQYDLDAPVEKVTEGRMVHYRYLDPNFSIKNLPIKQDEVALLKDAIDIIRQVSGYSIMEDLEAIVRKLENTITTNVQDRYTVIQFEQNAKVAGSDLLDGLFAAVKEKAVLRIRYQPFFKGVIDYTFHPYLLKEYRNRWFLIGQADGQDDITTLALDRISKIANSSAKFKENTSFDPDTYYNNMVGVTLPKGAVQERITLLVDRDKVPYIITKPLHSSQQLTEQLPDGSARFTLDVVNNYELRSLILGNGPQVKVEAPELLCNQMAALYRNGAAAYEPYLSSLPVTE
ncbi:helix-turn-helix transcriptional regulator [Flavihumibacter profundi]|uniref:helix-turn-helix transcriptional regulator n=1 Tax=Flavihumibacter profundi TaxID=2716883 RepID=UPI001CC76947|nr:WYL domain-containing protein [Flavihumibacter profundi]MBZ5857553.1 WYL domain-containing protein [Flavihumibacter profundi]